MNVIPNPPVPVYPAQEPPRPAQHAVQESSHPVLEPTRTEAIAQETRHGEGHSGGQQARADVHAQTSPLDPAAAKKGQDLLVGAILDVFA